MNAITKTPKPDTSALVAKPSTRKVQIDQAQFARYWNASTHCELMGEIFGISASGISARAHRMGLRPRNVLGDTIDITRDEFASLWNGPKSIGVIASYLKCVATTVPRLAEYFDLDPRPEQAKPMKGAPKGKPPVVGLPGSDFWTEARDLKVLASKGRYGRVADLAKAFGIPSTRIMARWHLLRAAQ